MKYAELDSNHLTDLISSCDLYLPTDTLKVVDSKCHVVTPAACHCSSTCLFFTAT